MNTQLKFYYNGIKENGGRLQLCSYTDGKLLHHPEGTITIYGKRYRDFSDGVRAAFTVENNTELETDYFENDRIRVTPDHPLYPQVRDAFLKYAARVAARRPRHCAEAIALHVA